jgi:hypothetical protein
MREDKLSPEDVPKRRRAKGVRILLISAALLIPVALMFALLSTHNPFVLIGLGALYSVVFVISFIRVQRSVYVPKQWKLAMRVGLLLMVIGFALIIWVYALGWLEP